MQHELRDLDVDARVGNEQKRAAVHEAKEALKGKMKELTKLLACELWP